MKLIANISNGKSTTGFRLLDIDTKQTKDVSENDMKQSLKSEKISIENLKLNGYYLVGSNGSIDRLPTR